MTTKIQVIIAVVLVIAATIGIFGQNMINLPFLEDSLCLWVHYIICAFSGLFGLIWLYFVGEQNDMLIRFRKEYYSMLEENCKLSAEVNELTSKLCESESVKEKLKTKIFSYQGNLAQMSKRYKALKHAEKHIVD